MIGNFFAQKEGYLMKRILLLVVALIAISAPAFASDWRYLTSSANGEQLYIDMDSISQHGSYADVWIEYVTPGGVDKQLVRVTTNKKMGVLAYAHYDSRGMLEDSDEDEYSYRLDPIIPDSVGEAVYVAVFYS